MMRGTSNEHTPPGHKWIVLRILLEEEVGAANATMGEEGCPIEEFLRDGSGAHKALRHGKRSKHSQMAYKTGGGSIIHEINFTVRVERLHGYRPDTTHAPAMRQERSNAPNVGWAK